MTTQEKYPSEKRQSGLVTHLSMICLLLLLVGCSPSPEDLSAVDYTPLAGGDWKISTPEEQGLDPMLVAELYYDAGKLDSIYSLLIIKNDRLIAEKYFNDGSIDLKSKLQSFPSLPK